MNTYTGDTTLIRSVLRLTGAGSIAASGRLRLFQSEFDISAVAGDSVTLKNIFFDGSGLLDLGGKTLNVTDFSAATYLIYANVNGGHGADALNITLDRTSINLDALGMDFTNWDESTDTLRLVGNARSNIIWGGPVRTIIDGGAGNDRIFGYLGDDIIYGGIGELGVNGQDADEIYGNSGNDTLYGNAGDDRIYGGPGLDSIQGGPGMDTIYGGSGVFDPGDGADTINGNADGDTIYGNGGDDTLYGNGGSDEIYGDQGRDTIFGGSGGDIIYGGTGLTDPADAADTIYGNGGNDTIFGNGGDDILFGNEDGDTIYGGGGADTINGGTGNDWFSGNAGADTFVFDTALDGSANVDSIADFTPGTDRIALSRGVFTGIGATLTAAQFQTGPADSPEDRILYHPETGALSFDADGTGNAATPILFAYVARGTALAAADFLMIA